MKKASVAKLLDQLASQGDICVKTYGKSKVYYPKQEQYGDVSADELAHMDEEIRVRPRAAIACHRLLTRRRRS